jgi:hypothetical protein
MNTYRKEYFNDHCYFLIEESNDDYVLSYSVYNTISESKNNNNKKRFKKDKLKNIENKIQKIVKTNNKISKQEIDELVDSDGTLKSSRIPILNKKIYSPKPTTMDKIVAATSSPGYSMARGFRVYYGEGEEKDGNLIDEIDMSDAFGYRETKDMDYKQTVNTLKKMGVENPEERKDRAETFGKLPRQKVKKLKSGKKVLKQRLTEKDINEEKKERMIKMVEDMLTNKKNNQDVLEKENEENGLSKIITKNLQSIKNLAKKEGISINKLINILKKGE